VLLSFLVAAPARAVRSIRRVCARYALTFPRAYAVGAGGSLLLGTLATSAAAQDLPTLSGRWQAEALTVRWVIGQWGEACGPRPSGGGDAGGAVDVQQGPDELTFSGLGRGYSTSQCWEMHPGLSRGNHSGGRRAWSTTCRTAAGDPRQEILRTTITATDDVISFQEAGQYHFVVGGQTCSASSGRWRTFRLLQREGEAARAPVRSEPPAAVPPQAVPQEVPPRATPPAPAAPRPSEPRPNPCSKPGPPAQIEVRPAIKLLRPGEEFTFRARVLDAHGCTSLVPVGWRLDGRPGVAELEHGKLKVFDGVEDTELGIVATAAEQSVRVDVQVVSNERYRTLLESGGFNAEGALDAAAVAIISTGSIGTQPAQSETASEARKWTFVAVVGLAAVLLGAIGAVLLALANRRNRARAAEAGRVTSDETFARPAHGDTFAQPALTEDTFGASPTGPATKLEPLPQTDATRLQPLSARPAQPSPRRWVCPICGTLYTEPVANGCPKDGAELLPVNAPRH
jgi:hypothetical protein